MRFIIDAHLPPSLCEILRRAGHEAQHTRDFPERNRTTDSYLNEISAREQRAVVSKDSDFLHSHLLCGKPWKLLIVRTGNSSRRAIKTLFEKNVEAIAAALEQHSVVELTWDEVRSVR